MSDDDNLWTLAPEGKVYVCGACGKTSRNRAGFTPRNGDRNSTTCASPGWDESCMLNAVLCFERVQGETEWMPVASGWSVLT